MHTDGSEWPKPHDLTCLLCVRPDEWGGGRTRLLTIESVEAIVDRLPVEVRRAVSRPRSWVFTTPGIRAVDIQPEPDPIVGASGVRWLREAVMPPLTDAAASAEAGDAMSFAPLVVFAEALERSPEVATFDLAAGDFLVVDNARCLHSRTSIADPEASSRLVIRTRANQWR
jgi:hypothetical protein